MTSVTPPQHNDSERQRLGTVQKFTHAALNAYRTMKYESHWLKTKLEESQQRSALASREIEHFDRFIAAKINLNMRLNLSIDDAERLICELVVQRHELEMHCINLHAGIDQMLKDFADCKRLLRSKRFWLDSSSSQLREEVSNAADMAILINQQRIRREEEQEKNRLLTEQVKDKTELLRSRSLMHCSNFINMEAELSDVQAKAKAFQDASAELKRKNDKLQLLQCLQCELRQEARFLHWVLGIASSILHSLCRYWEWPKRKLYTCHVAIECLALCSKPLVPKVRCESCFCALALFI